MKTSFRVEHLYPRKIAADILRIERMRNRDAGAITWYANAIDTAARFGAENVTSLLTFHARKFDIATREFAI